MGTGSSKHEEGGGKSEKHTQLHPVLDNQQFHQVVREFQEIKRSKGGHVSAKAVCSALGVPESDAETVGHMFEVEGENAIEEMQFVDVVAGLCRGTTAEMRKYIWKGAGKLQTNLGGMFRFIFNAAGNAEEFNPEPFVNGLRHFSDQQAELDGTPKEEALNLLMFHRWCTSDCPVVQEPVSFLFMKHILKAGPAGGRVSGSTRLAASAIQKSETLSASAIFGLACCDSRCQGTWDMLFSSSKDGMSFDALAKSLIGYEGPTLLSVKDTEGSVFGALISETWKEAGQFYGRQDSLLFSLQPAFNIMRARGDGSSPGTGNFQYLKVRGRSGFHGVGFGGDENSLRFCLDRNFEECRASTFDLTYEDGPLRAKGSAAQFQPVVIEVWGLGGEDASTAQAAEHADLERMQNNRRQVDRKKFADNAFDREFLLGKTFQHQEQVANRGGQ